MDSFSQKSEGERFFVCLFVFQQAMNSQDRSILFFILLKRNVNSALVTKHLFLKDTKILIRPVFFFFIILKSNVLGVVGQGSWATLPIGVPVSQTNDFPVTTLLQRAECLSWGTSAWPENKRALRLNLSSFHSRPSDSKYVPQGKTTDPEYQTI